MPEHDADCLRGQGNEAVFTVDCPRCELEMATTSRGDFAYVEEEDE